MTTNRDYQRRRYQTDPEFAAKRRASVKRWIDKHAADPEFIESKRAACRRWYEKHRDAYNNTRRERYRALHPKKENHEPATTSKCPECGRRLPRERREPVEHAAD